jgi:hypothetical protein
MSALKNSAVSIEPSSGNGARSVTSIYWTVNVNEVLAFTPLVLSAPVTDMV